MVVRWWRSRHERRRRKHWERVVGTYYLLYGPHGRQTPARVLDEPSGDGAGSAT